MRSHCILLFNHLFIQLTSLGAYHAVATAIGEGDIAIILTGKVIPPKEILLGRGKENMR